MLPLVKSINSSIAFEILTTYFRSEKIFGHLLVFLYTNMEINAEATFRKKSN